MEQKEQLLQKDQQIESQLKEIARLKKLLEAKEGECGER